MDSKMRRHNQILSLLSRQSRLSVNELSDVLGTSAATVRKDLAALEERQLIRREQGYASLETENPISRRMAFHYAAKSEIASSAADLVRDGDTVFIESGSTCILLAEELRRRETTVNIVTNSVFMAAYLKETGHLRLTLTGGDYQSDSMALVGPLAVRSLSNFHVKYFFTGADGYSPDIGFSGDNLLRVELLHRMAAQADRTVLLFHHEKFSHKGTLPLFSEKEIDILITEAPVRDAALLERLRMEGVEIMVTGEAEPFTGL